MWANPLPTGYWWTGRPNWGDLLTPLLMARVAAVEVVWAPAADARCVVVGSVLEHLPAGWSGVVAGAGTLHPDRPLTFDLDRASILGVRGPLTAARLPAWQWPGLVLGDPGLLASDLVAPVDQIHDLGLVPHWSDHLLEQRPEFLRFDPLIIRPDRPPLEIVAQIASCKKIVSSSLHGVIVADAFGIPRRTEMAAIFTREGNAHKFRDHAGAVGVPFQVGVTQTPDRFHVQNVQSALYDELEMLGRLLEGKRRPA